MNEFDRWQGRFAADHYVFGTEPNAFLASQADLLTPGLAALSIADGEGRNGVWLAEQGLEVTSQDFSPNAQDKARRLAQERGVSLEFELSDLTQRHWQDQAFDVVVGIFFQFLEPEARAQVFGNMIKTLKPGGLILIQGYGPKQLEYGTGGPKRLENLYTAQLLQDTFAHFVDLNVTEYTTEISEGPGHSGMSALVDLVGRKPV